MPFHCVWVNDQRISIKQGECTSNYFFSHHLVMMMTMALRLPKELEGLTFIIADRLGTVEFPPQVEIVKQLKLT